MKRNAKNNLPCNCLYCGKLFYAARATAKFCPSGKCKTAYHRERQKTGGNTWNDVNPELFDKYHLVKAVSDETALMIYEILCKDGAYACEKSIQIAYTGVVACLQSDMFKQSEIACQYNLLQPERV